MRFFYSITMTIPELYSIFLRHPQIVIDSRKAIKDSIFFALKGALSDGNRFAHIALENGCAFAVIDNREYAVSDKYLVVDDVLLALQALALHHRKKFKIPFIAVTGTNGKTTTKELINQVLSSHKKVHATAGNLNNHIGVPLTILSLPPGAEIAIIEMGANHQGEIAFLCDIALPTHGLITNVGIAHLEGFGSLEGVIKTKTELYRFLDQTKGVVFVNSGQQVLLDQSALLNCERVLYGSSPKNFCSGVYAGVDPFLSFLLKDPSGKKPGQEMQIQTKLVGKYNLDNVLAAACIGMYFGIDVNEIKQSIESYVPGNQRSQLMKTAANLLILDNYNANPSSMKAALEDFSKFPHPNKVLVLGDMLELGEQAIAEHEHVLEQISSIELNKVFLVGSFFEAASSGKKHHVFADSASLAEYLKIHPVKDVVVLIKGSRGIKLEKIIDYL
jgi:UDP-N-acetylmuramoyl-tripeptide--D-alanyl-D-alanine ligase